MKSQRKQPEFPGVDPEELRQAYHDAMVFRFWCLGVGLILLVVAVASSFF